MEELLDDVRRMTLPLPFGIDHVHVYLLRAPDGSWTLVDTGLGTGDPEAVWAGTLAELDGPVERVLVTHLHPDHVGGAADVAALTGATVLQGSLDHEQTLAVWADPDAPARIASHFARHGLAGEEAERLRVESERLQPRVHFSRDVEPVGEGDQVAGWDVLHLPGHADGHLALVRDGVLVAGDTILAGITPTVGRYPGGNAGPLRAYLDSLDRIASLGLRVAFAGHRAPVLDPAARAREIAAHHAGRLDLAAESLRGGPRTAAEATAALFDPGLSVTQLRFAIAESLAHLERLVEQGRARTLDDDDVVRFAAPG